MRLHHAYSHSPCTRLHSSQVLPGSPRWCSSTTALKPYYARPYTSRGSTCTPAVRIRTYSHASSFHCLRTPPRPHSAAAAASTHPRRRRRRRRAAVSRRAAARRAAARRVDASRANARCAAARRAAARRAATRRHPMCHRTASRAAHHCHCHSPSLPLALLPSPPFQPLPLPSFFRHRQGGYREIRKIDVNYIDFSCPSPESKNRRGINSNSSLGAVLCRNFEKSRFCRPKVRIANPHIARGSGTQRPGYRPTRALHATVPSSSGPARKHTAKFEPAAWSWAQMTSGFGAPKRILSEEAFTFKV